MHTAHFGLGAPGCCPAGLWFDMSEVFDVGAVYEVLNVLLLFLRQPIEKKLLKFGAVFHDGNPPAFTAVSYTSGRSLANCKLRSVACLAPTR